MHLTDRGQKALTILVCAWPLVIVVPLVHVPLPMFVTGHPWRAELVLSIYAALITGTTFFAKRSQLLPFSKEMKAATTVAILIAAFLVLGLASALWAGSLGSVIHHTFLWSLYLAFFFIATSIVHDRRLLRGSLLSLGVAVSVYCAICAFEFFLRPSLDQTFGFRYARYAEISAALLPLVAAFLLRLRGRNFAFAAIAGCLLFIQVIASQSRTALIASLLGLGVFALLQLFFDRTRSQIKRLAFVAGLLAVAGLSTQLPSLISGARTSALARFGTSAASDPANSIGQNVRRQFIGVGLEMAKANILIGVGADNFGLEYNKYRAVYSARTDDKAIAAYGEDGLPERAHNEYLQVLAESGVTGLVLFAAILLCVLFAGYRFIRHSENHSYTYIRTAALAGIIAFLASSTFSSFSFRLGQNGIVFFFLAALLLRNQRADNDKKVHKLKLFVPVLFVLSLTGLAFFSMRGYSQYLVNAGERKPDAIEAAQTFDRALMFDPANSSAHFSYAMRLLNEHAFADSARHFRAAVDLGINNVTTYSYLITALYLSGDQRSARDVATEAVKIFPYSAFTQTRLALLEGELGNTEAADLHFAKAAEIDPKASVTWRVLISEGVTAAADAGRRGEGVGVLYDLEPQNTMWAIIAERQIRFPNETFTFPGAEKP